MQKRTWTDDDLRRAVATSKSWDEVLGVLGESGERRLRLRQQRAVMLRLDKAHLLRPPTPRRSRRWNDEQLLAAIESSTTIAQVLTKLGLIPAGGNYVQIQRRMRELGVDTSHMMGQRVNRGETLPRPSIPLEELLVADRWTASHTLKLRLFAAGLKRPACEECGWARQAADGRIPVELDHISGDKSDNRLENLRILCPNCHALKPTHRGLNQRRRKRELSA